MSPLSTPGTQMFTQSTVKLEPLELTFRNTVYMLYIYMFVVNPSTSPKTLLSPTFTMGSHYVVDVPCLFCHSCMHVGIIVN